MKFNSLFIYIFLFSGVFILGCEELSLATEEEYPTFFEKLPIAELESRNEEFQLNNNDYVCSTLNEYGFTGFSRVLFQNDRNPCLDREAPRVQFNFSTNLISEAVNFLKLNSEFTGLTQNSVLELIETDRIEGCTICEGPDRNSVPLEWRFVFNNQIKDGIEVEETKITVFIDANGVNSVWGNWYNFEQPDFINVGFITAKESLVGKTLTRQDSSIVVVSSSMLENEAELIYVPFERQDKLEILKAWKIPIYDSASQIIMWYGYIDVSSGEILKIKSLTEESQGSLQF